MLVKYQQEHQDNQDQLMKELRGVKSELDLLRLELKRWKDQVMVKLDESTNLLMTDIKENILTNSKESRDIMKTQIENLQTKVEKEVVAVKKLLEEGVHLSDGDMEQLTLDLAASLKGCCDDLKPGIRTDIETVCKEMQDVLRAAMSSESDTSRKNFARMLESYEVKLNDLKTTSDSILKYVSDINNHQKKALMATTDLLRDGQADLAQKIADFSNEICSKTMNVGDVTTKLQLMSAKDDRLEKFETQILSVMNDIQQSLQSNHSSSEDFDCKAMILMKQLGHDMNLIAKEIENVHQKLGDLPSTINTDIGVLMAGHSQPLLDTIKAVEETTKLALDDVGKVNSTEELGKHIETMESSLKSWLSTAIMEATEERTEAVNDAIHTQYKVTNEKLSELQTLYTQNQQDNGAMLEETKEGVMNLLTEVNTTLGEVLSGVNHCEKTCSSLAVNVDKLTEESETQAERTCELLDSLHGLTNDTRLNISNGSEETVLQALYDLQENFKTHLNNQNVSADLQASINISLQEIKEQHLQGTSENQINVAATQHKLDMVMESLESSRKKMDLLLSAAECQHELLALLEKKSNLLPSKFIIVPDLKHLTDSNFFKRVALKAKKLFWKKVRLIFVCDLTEKYTCSCGPDGFGYELEIPTKLLQVLLPVVQASMLVLRAVMQVHGFPTGFFPKLPDLPKHVILQAIINAVPDADELIEKAGAHCDDIDLEERLEKASDINEGRVDQLYRLIQKREGNPDSLPLNDWEPKYVGLKKVAVENMGVKGTSKWVLEEHEELFRQHGDSARNLLESKSA